MWISVLPGTGDKPFIVHVSLPKKTVVDVSKPLEVLPNSLWALCEDASKTNKLAGSLQNGSLISYGYLNENGAFIPLESARLPVLTPPPLVLTGLLTMPPSGGYFMAAYPKGMQPDAASPAGYLAFGDYKGSGSLKLAKVSYYLVGASAVF